MWSVKGLIAVLVTAGVLAVPLFKYWEFLTAGMRPPESTRRLDELEKGVPDFAVKALDGTEISLSSLRGKVVLVNLWATWCAPCVKEFPSLQGLVRKMKGKVVVLAVSHDRSREDLDTFVKTFGSIPEGFLIAWDPEKKTGEFFGTEVLPETYIISKDGKLVRKIAGETTWDDQMALRFFEQL